MKLIIFTLLIVEISQAQTPSDYLEIYSKDPCQEVRLVGDDMTEESNNKMWKLSHAGPIQENTLKTMNATEEMEVAWYNGSIFSIKLEGYSSAKLSTAKKYSVISQNLTTTSGDELTPKHFGKAILITDPFRKGFAPNEKIEIAVFYFGDPNKSPRLTENCTRITDFDPKNLDVGKCYWLDGNDKSNRYCFNAMASYGAKRTSPAKKQERVPLSPSPGKVQ